MSAVLAVVAALAVVAGCGGASREGPGPQRSSTHAVGGQSQHTTVPEDAIFWSAKDGLLEVAECGAGGHSCTGSGVELTTDGGRSYHFVRRTQDRNDTLETVGRRGAEIRPHTLSGRTALLTLDRGRTWKRVPYDYRVTWATRRIGLRSALGKDFYSVKLSATHDGGKTWQRLPSPCHMLGPIASPSLPSPSRWWLFCEGEPEPGSPNGAMALFSAVDAGRHWKLEASTANRTLSRNAGGPVFAPDGFGFLLGYPRVFVTRDGGKTYTKLPAGLIPVAAFNGGIGFALERGHPLPATLLETRDSGRTWHAVHHWRG